jgi:hypothetical protein
MATTGSGWNIPSPPRIGNNFLHHALELDARNELEYLAEHATGCFHIDCLFGQVAVFRPNAVIFFGQDCYQVELYSRSHLISLSGTMVESTQYSVPLLLT